MFFNCRIFWYLLSLSLALSAEATKQTPVRQSRPSQHSSICYKSDESVFITHCFPGFSSFLHKRLHVGDVLFQLRVLQNLICYLSFDFLNFIFVFLHFLLMNLKAKHTLPASFREYKGERQLMKMFLLFFNHLFLKCYSFLHAGDLLSRITPWVFLGEVLTRGEIIKNKINLTFYNVCSKNV